jgi:large subunit ribosomal protein L5|tara:strand:+ start:3050 stop:3703 length:654 start_codon:yes stop_codon:yes gene_type:complete
MASEKKSVSKKSAKSSKKSARTKVVSYMPNLRKHYLESIIPKLIKRFKYANPMQVPKLTTIAINMGVGDAKVNPKALESAVEELTLISGQKPIITLSKKDISNFKIRRGFPVGCKVTIRGNRMYEFLERLITVAMPRTRDFRGLSFKSFDKRGNYNFGVTEQIIFTEINYDKIDSVRGMDISIVTTAKSDDEGYWLLKEFGFPLREKPVKEEMSEVD